MQVKEVQQKGPFVAQVVIIDDHGHERVLQVTHADVEELEQDVLIPVSDELTAVARDAVGTLPPILDSSATLTPEDYADASVVPRPQVGTPGAAGGDPKATLGMPFSDRPRIGTGEVALPELGTATDEFESLEELAEEEERVSRPHVGEAAPPAGGDVNVTQQLPVQEILDADD